MPKLSDLSKEELIAIIDSSTGFVVSALSDEMKKDSDSDLWQIYVLPSEGKWVVSRHNEHWSDLLNKDGFWIPRDRSRKVAHSQFSLPVALAKAEEAAKTVSVNGITPEGLIVWHKARAISQANTPEGSTPDETSVIFYKTILSMNPDEQLRETAELRLQYIANN